jgi:hypothetical protein
LVVAGYLGTLGMRNAPPTFPFFVSVDQRDLTDLERALVVDLLRREAPQYLEQVPDLRVVGRCGCGSCPTVFFKRHAQDDRHQELASYMGTDPAGGVTGVVLWQCEGALSQLEFYSVDGHDPWAIPSIETIYKPHA